MNPVPKNEVSEVESRLAEVEISGGINSTPETLKALALAVNKMNPIAYNQLPQQVRGRLAALRAELPKTDTHQELTFLRNELDKNLVSLTGQKGERQYLKGGVESAANLYGIAEKKGAGFIDETIQSVLSNETGKKLLDVTTEEGKAASKEIAKWTFRGGLVASVVVFPWVMGKISDGVEWLFTKANRGIQTVAGVGAAVAAMVTTFSFLPDSVKEGIKSRLSGFLPSSLRPETPDQKEQNKKIKELEGEVQKKQTATNDLLKSFDAAESAQNALRANLTQAINDEITFTATLPETRRNQLAGRVSFLQGKLLQINPPANAPKPPEAGVRVLDSVDDLMKGLKDGGILDQLKGSYKVKGIDMRITSDAMYFKNRRVIADLSTFGSAYRRQDLLALRKEKKDGKDLVLISDLNVDPATNLRKDSDISPETFKKKINEAIDYFAKNPAADSYSDKIFGLYELKLSLE